MAALRVQNIISKPAVSGLVLGSEDFIAAAEASLDSHPELKMLCDMFEADENRYLWGHMGSSDAAVYGLGYVAHVLDIEQATAIDMVTYDLAALSHGTFTPEDIIGGSLADS